VRLEALGGFQFSIYGSYPDDAQAMIAVFSASPGITGAIQTTLPTVVTAPTLFAGIPTDIAQDFSVTDVTVTVPVGAAYLLIGIADRWYSDNADPNGDLAFRLTPSPSCALQDLTVSPGSTIGGGVNPRGVTGTITLGQPAGAGGVEVTLAAQTNWAALNIAAPKIATVSSTVTVPQGQTTVTFPITTSQVLFPLGAKITAQACGTSKSATLTVTPPAIPSNGAAAWQRVAAINDFFAQAGTQAAAMDAIIEVRNAYPATGVKYDIYLAASDHYYFAYTMAIADQSYFTGLALLGVIPAYEVFKWVKQRFATNPEESAPTQLSVDWGEQGAMDALEVLLGPGVVKGPTARSVPAGPPVLP
jgi:hypothetical protein